jgi:hypothetical protein
MARAKQKGKGQYEVEVDRPALKPLPAEPYQYAVPPVHIARGRRRLID